jgi:hypothetical protein
VLSPFWLITPSDLIPGHFIIANGHGFADSPLYFCFGYIAMQSSKTQEHNEVLLSNCVYPKWSFGSTASLGLNLIFQGFVV